MEKVYSVMRGHITEFEVTKETNCFYNVATKDHTNKLAKDGLSFQVRHGGRSVVTKDILHAVTVAQDQINTIQHYLDYDAAKNLESEALLKAFSDKHTVSE